MTPRKPTTSPARKTGFLLTSNVDPANFLSHRPASCSEKPASRSAANDGSAMTPLNAGVNRAGDALPALTPSRKSAANVSAGTAGSAAGVGEPEPTRLAGTGSPGFVGAVVGDRPQPATPARAMTTAVQPWRTIRVGSMSVLTNRGTERDRVIPSGRPSRPAGRTGRPPGNGSRGGRRCRSARRVLRELYEARRGRIP